MSSTEKKSLPDIIAKTISVIFHPLFMPVYGLALILSPASPFGYLPFHVKRILLTIMIIDNVILPLSLLPMLNYLKFITSLTISDRKERSIPLIITTILYAATSYMIFRFPIAAFIRVFIFSTFFLSLIVTIVNFRWRISLHSAGAGAIIALMLQIVFNLNAQMQWELISAIIAAGLIMSSRLYLKKHDPLEVWGGFFTGFAGLTLFMILLQ